MAVTADLYAPPRHEFKEAKPASFCVRLHRCCANGTLLIKPSKKNVTSFLKKVREIIKDHKQATVGHLICLLNPLIRGWARYHRHIVSKKVFAFVDCAIYHAMRRWALR